jgi:type IV secretion system protein VirD4
LSAAVGKALIATGAFLVTLVTATMGYAIASAVLTYQDLGFGAEIDFAYISQNYPSILDQRPENAQLTYDNRSGTGSGYTYAAAG